MQINPCTDIIAVVCDAADFCQTGLPFDTIDALVVTDSSDQEWAKEFAKHYSRDSKVMIEPRQSQLDADWQLIAQLADNERELLELIKQALFAAKTAIEQGALSLN